MLADYRIAVTARTPAVLIQRYRDNAVQAEPTLQTIAVPRAVRPYHR